MKIGSNIDRGNKTMKNPAKYNDSEKLTFFLDGELESSEEPALLERVNADEELRRQFDEESRINAAAKAEPPLMPPPELKENIFGELGYNPNPDTVPFFVRYKKYFIAASLILIGTTSLIVYNSIDNSSDITDKNNQSEQVEERIPVVSSKEIDNNDNNTKEPRFVESPDNNSTQSSKQPVYAGGTTGTDADNSRSIAENTEPVKSETSDNTRKKETKTNTIRNSARNIFAVPNARTAYADCTMRFSSHLNTADKGMPAITFIPQAFNYSPSIPGELRNELTISAMNFNSAELLGDGAVTIGYIRNWKSGFSLGIEGAYEKIDRIVFDTENQLITGTRRSTAASVSSVIRYELDAAEFFGIKPFVSGRIGLAMNANYLYGACAGLNWCPRFMPFGIQAAYDYKSFNYYYGGTRENSENFNKQGFTIGLIYSF